MSYSEPFLQLLSEVSDKLGKRWGEITAGHSLPFPHSDFNGAYGFFVECLDRGLISRTDLSQLKIWLRRRQDVLRYVEQWERQNSGTLSEDSRVEKYVSVTKSHPKGLKYFESLSKSEVGKTKSFLEGFLNLHENELRKFPLLRNIENFLGSSGKLFDLLKEFPFVGECIHASLIMAQVTNPELYLDGNLDFLIEEAIKSMFEGCRTEQLLCMDKKDFDALVYILKHSLAAIVSSEFGHASTIVNNHKLIVEWAEKNGENRLKLVKTIKENIGSLNLPKSPVFFFTTKEEVKKQYMEVLSKQKTVEIMPMEKNDWPETVIKRIENKTGKILSKETKQKFINFLVKEGMEEDNLDAIDHEILKSYGFDKLNDRITILKGISLLNK